MNDIINKKCFVLLLFLSLTFSGCSASGSEQSTENTAPLRLSLQLPATNQSGIGKTVNALSPDVNRVASLKLSVTDKAGKVVTAKTISVTPKALVSISFDAPLGRALSINATLFNTAGKPLFKGRSIPLDFERGRSQSLTILMNFIESLLGSWLLVEDNGIPVGEGADPAVLTFISGSEYFMADTGARSEDCFVGVEHGFYSWNVLTDIFNVTSNIVDTTGGCGLHSTNAGEGPLVNAKLSVNNDTLLLVAPDGESSKFTRVQSDTNPLIGVWVGATDVSSTVITFVSDTEYFLVDDHSKDPVPCDGVSLQNSGMEHGTYTHNLITGAFSVTNAGNILDTNGGCGLNEPPIDPFANGTLTIKNDTFVLKDSNNILVAIVSRINFIDYFPIVVGKSWKYQNAADPTDTFTNSVEAIRFGGKAALKVGEAQFHFIIDSDTSSLNILAIRDEGLLVDIPDVSIGIVSDGMVLKLDPTSVSPDTLFRFWDHINPAVKDVYGIDPLLNDLIVWVSLDNNQAANNHNTALGVPASLGAVTEIAWYQKGIGEIVFIDIDAATGNIVSHYDLVTSGNVFEAATVPGIYQQVLVNNSDGLTNVLDFKANGTGVAEFSDFTANVAFVDPFNWTVDAQGVLIVNYTNDAPQTLPDRYTLVSGTVTDGIADAKVDENQDGVYESFPALSFTKIIPAQNFNTTLKKTDTSNQNIFLTRGAFFDSAALPGSYRLLLPDTAQDLVVNINANGTGSIEFVEIEINSIIWKITADGVLRFIETNFADEQRFWSITRIANNVQNSLVSVLTPVGQIGSSDLNILGDFTPFL